MSTVFHRYDATGSRIMVQEAEGYWVLAQDAYDKVASLEAKIATLETQLKAARKDAASFKIAGAAINGQVLYTKHV